ncbi:MAG: hypothetical protein DHS20C17_29440 [Cyclobacteriaceae bacterium]|nr:MAG: hypothetical protein DHS20C17_29440 [Cyclobacteriaceae bacterium]
MSQDQDWEEDGAIQDAEVVIEKDRQITLETANRGYEKVSPLPVQTNSEPQTYSFTPIEYTATPFTPRIRINRIKEQPLPKLYGNYVKGGIGNYGTTYLEGFFNNKRSETHSIGAHIKSLSAARGPIDKSNSASSAFDLGVNGKYFTENLTFTGGLDYGRQKLFYYGYTPGTEVNRDSIKQVYNTMDIRLEMEDSKKGEGVDFSLAGGYTAFWDHFEGNEDQGIVNFFGKYQIHDQLGISLQSDLYFTSRVTRNHRQNRNFFRVRPMIYTTIDGFTLEAGLNLVYENDTIANSNKLHIAPMAVASINLTDKITAYAGISGDVDYRSLESYVKENPFIGPDVALSHNIKVLEIAGGLKGSLWDRASFHTGLSIGTYKNLAFYANSATDSTKFDILYDTGKPNLVQLFGEFEYSQTGKWLANIRGDLYGYDTKELAEAWGRPTYSLKVSGNYNLYKKLIFNASINALGGIKALNQQSGNQQKLEAIFDANLGVDYLFSPKFSAFVLGENLFSKEYQQYLNYPSRGFTVIAGITYSF